MSPLSSYTSKKLVDKYLKRNSNEALCTNPSKISRRSVTPFSFKEDCTFCAETCQLERDAKNPSRWKPAYLCRDTLLKEKILESCDGRNDEWGTDVRIETAVSDLHAADARYHVTCRRHFFGKRYQSDNGGNFTTETSETDNALTSLIAEMQSDSSRIWNSVELFTCYRGFGGTKLSRKHLMEHLSSHFGDDLLLLTSPGNYLQ